MLLTGKLYKEEKQKLYDAQAGKCPICHRDLDSDVQANHLDHDHELNGPKAGKVRGLLCNRTQATTGSDCYNCPGAQWTGTNTTLTTYTYPLNALNSETNVIFRIVFHSDESANQLGVNIDDFVINGTLSNQNFELQNIVLYPNPSKGIFNIALGTIEPSAIDVYDVTGKIVWSKKDFAISNAEVSLDLSAVAQGI